MGIYDEETVKAFAEKLAGQAFTYRLPSGKNTRPITIVGYINSRGYYGFLIKDSGDFLTYKTTEELLAKSHTVSALIEFDSCKSVPGRFGKFFAHDGLDVLEFETKLDSVSLKDYPHKCARCGSAAYIGFSKTECSKGKDCK